MTQSKMYKRHRFSPEVIQYAVWLYHRFNLSHRDVEDLMAEWCMRKFKSMGQAKRFWTTRLCVLGKGSGNLEEAKQHILSAGAVNLCGLPPVNNKPAVSKK